MSSRSASSDEHTLFSEHKAAYAKIPVEVLDELMQRYGRIAWRAFRNVQAETKADGTTVTQLDRDISALVIETLREYTPDWGVVSEEEGEHYRPDAEYTWYVDPLDGTASFARGFPVWGLGIGLLHRGRPVAGYLRFPVTDETFTWDRRGFLFNGGPAPEPQRDVPADALNLLLDASLHKHLGGQWPLPGYKMRNFGSTLYHIACVALGRSEGMVCGQCYLWDLAAALPMSRSRGLVERYLDGSPLRLEDLGPEQNYRLPGPLLIAAPERIDEIRLPLAAALGL